MNKDQIKEMAQGFGWIDLGPQKNVYMLSFKKEESDVRMNVYFTTMTITLQSPTIDCLTYKNVDMLKFEEILSS